MPRIARVVIPEYPHHITQRGNYRQNTFSESADYISYLKWLRECCNKYELFVLSYCLMPNHVHFIAVPKKQDSLAKVFNTCHMRYSQHYNRKNHITGHLWQGRFYSCVLDDTHLYAAMRYVENNPMRVKLVKKVEEWEWSSAREHLGLQKHSYLPLAQTGDYVKITDWQGYLVEEEDKAIVRKVRANTLTGRPSGRDVFVSKLEKLLGRRLRPLPNGRPAKTRNRN